MRLKRGRVVVVAVDIAQQAAQLVERRGIEPAVLLDAVAGPGPELVEIPAGLGHADDRHVEMAALHHRLQRRERSSCRPGRPWRRRTPVHLQTASCIVWLSVIAAGFSRWPPNS